MEEVKLTNGDLIQILRERIRNAVPSVTLDTAHSVAEYLIESGSVTDSTLFDRCSPPIEPVKEME